MVEEPIHIKFDDRELDNKMSELVKSFSDFYVFVDTLGADGPEVDGL